MNWWYVWCVLCFNSRNKIENKARNALMNDGSVLSKNGNRSVESKMRKVGDSFDVIQR